MLRLGVHVMRSNAASVMSYAVCRMQRQEYVDVSNFAQMGYHLVCIRVRPSGTGVVEKTMVALFYDDVTMYLRYSYYGPSSRLTRVTLSGVPSGGSRVLGKLEVPSGQHEVLQG